MQKVALLVLLEWMVLLWMVLLVHTDSGKTPDLSLTSSLPQLGVLQRITRGSLSNEQYMAITDSNGHFSYL